MKNFQFFHFINCLKKKKKSNKAASSLNEMLYEWDEIQDQQDLWEFKIYSRDY